MNLINLKLTTLIFLLGGLGACLRFGLSSLSFRLTSKLWTGTFLVNVLGCLIFFLLTRYSIDDRELEGVLKIGFLGSLTTFSTFSFEVVSLLKNGQYLEGGLVLFLNIFFGIVIGIWILR